MTAAPEYFAVTNVGFGHASSVRDPQDPFLRIRLLSTNAPTAELRLSYLGALDLMEQISSALHQRARRHDVFDALMRSTPLPMKE